MWNKYVTEKILWRILFHKQIFAFNCVSYTLYIYTKFYRVRLTRSIFYKFQFSCSEAFFIGKGNVHVIWNWRNKWIIDPIFRFYFVKKFTILSCVWYHIVIELLNCVWNVFLQDHLVVVRCSEVIIKSDHYLCFGCLGLPFLLSTVSRLLCRWKMYSRT